MMGRIRYPRRAVLCLVAKSLLVLAINFGWVTRTERELRTILP
jgi:hypothetical protein